MEYYFSKELYPKIALLKAAYAFIDSSYIHLDADDCNWIVFIEPKNRSDAATGSEKDFLNEMLVQSLRHEIYMQTKNIREMLYARSIASSLLISDHRKEPLSDSDNENMNKTSENDILQDWFEQQ